MSEDREYAQGGYIPDGLGCAPVHPDECLIKPSDYLDGRFVCRRPGHPTPTSDCAHAPAPAAPDTTGGELREELVDVLHRQLIAPAGEIADAVLTLPALRDLIAERDTLAAQVQAVEGLFAGGPDTPCRTTWRPDPSVPKWAAVSIECVEVPMDDLRCALGTPTTGGGE